MIYNKKKVNYFFLLKIWLIMFIFFIRKIIIINNFNLNKKNKIINKIIIEVDISGKEGGRGPSKYIEGINEILPYNTNKCYFIASNSILPINGKNKTDFFFIPFPRFDELTYNEWIRINKTNRLILGPSFVPFFWSLFPLKHIWYERRFGEIVETIKGVGVHSKRVRNHLARKSNTTHLLTKYKIIRPCTNLNPKIVKPFDNRKIDILFFEKYQDLDHSYQGAQILNLFKNTSKTIEQLIYGNYTKEKMINLANDSKFIIYFSFYDSGAIGLKEIQNYGVLAFTHQKDLVIDKDTSFFVPELANEYDLKPAFFSIMKQIKKLTNAHPNTQLIAIKNQNINKCSNALDDLCKNI